MARPQIEVDWRKVDKLLEAGCDGTECAAFFGFHEASLYRACKRDHKIGFAEYSHQKKSKGNASLRAKQYELAMSGDRTMLIWQGKNRLGQSDKTELHGPDGGDIVIRIHGDIPD